jgi:hypothetical protein
MARGSDVAGAGRTVRRPNRGAEPPQTGGDAVGHNMLLVFEATILVPAIFLGFEVISKVPTLLRLEKPL